MKNIFKIILSFLLLTNLSYAEKWNENVFNFSKAGEKVYNNIYVSSQNGLNGLEKNGKIIVPCKFKEMRIEILSKNLIYIRPKNRKNYSKENRPDCYLINSDGKILHKSSFLVFDKVLNHNLWLMRDDDGFPNGDTSYGLLDENGNFIIPVGKYEYLSLQLVNPYGPDDKFEDRKYIPVWTQDKKIGLVDFQGKELIKPAYDKVEQISGKQIIFYKNNFATLLDDKLNTLIPLGKYTKFEDWFKNSNIILAKNKDKVFVVDKRNQKVVYTFKNKKYSISPFFKNTWKIYDNDILTKIVDENFNEIIDTKKYKDYRLKTLMNNNIELTNKKDKLIGVMNLNEKVIIPVKYYSVRYVSKSKYVSDWNTGGFSVPIIKGGGAVFVAFPDRSYKNHIYIYLEDIKEKYLEKINAILKGKYLKFPPEKIYISDKNGNILDVSPYKKIKITADKKVQVKNNILGAWKTLEIKK
ncbi:MAG: WG repeat-containing protein [Fusobacterium sp.]|nr:WG repeat-containing protein [Fusobacterium sp.]